MRKGILLILVFVFWPALMIPFYMVNNTNPLVPLFVFVALVTSLRVFEKYWLDENETVVGVLKDFF